MPRGLVNYLGLQLGWLACAWGAANGRVWLGPVVVAAHLGIHLLWSDFRRSEVIFIAIVTLLGLVVDSLQKVTGLVLYAADFPSLPWLAPAWIVARSPIKQWLRQTCAAIIEFSPISTFSPIKAPAPMITPELILAPDEITAFGPISTFRSTTALSST